LVEDQVLSGRVRFLPTTLPSVVLSLFAVAEVGSAVADRVERVRLDVRDCRGVLVVGDETHARLSGSGDPVSIAVACDGEGDDDDEDEGSMVDDDEGEQVEVLLRNGRCLSERLLLCRAVCR
jgi:hypothetical protein